MVKNYVIDGNRKENIIIKFKDWGRGVIFSVNYKGIILYWWNTFVRGHSLRIKRSFKIVWGHTSLEAHLLDSALILGNRNQNSMHYVSNDSKGPGIIIAFSVKEDSLWKINQKNILKVNFNLKRKMYHKLN